MPFQTGHPPYRRSTRLAVAEVTDDTPAPAVGPVRRWQLADLDAWFLARLNFRWAATEQAWRGKLSGFSASNEYLFVTNGEAVLLALLMRHPMTGKPIVMEICAFARDADERDGVYNVIPKSLGDAAIRALYRHLREWGKSMGAARLYIGVCSDILPSILRDMMGADAYYLVGTPC